MENPTALMGLLLQYLVGFVVFAVFIQLLFCYTIEVIADKQDLPAAWLAWVPLLQIYPVVKSGDGSMVQLLVLMLSLVAVILTGALLAPVLSPLVGVALVLGWSLWASVYFGRLLWNTATNRGLSGWVGLAVFLPLVGPFAYLYIAFHDGFTAPSKLGLALGIILYALPAVPMLRSDSELGQLSALGAQLGAGNDAAALQLLAQMGQAEGADPAELEQMLDQLRDLSGGGEAAPSAAPLPAGYDPESGFPVMDAFVCPDGARERGAAPPVGHERWCERQPSGLPAVRHGSYAAWHPNGSFREFGHFHEGQRDGVWTRWYESGGKRAQA
ncbi:MAG: hypothetical protein ABFS46_08695, partial [Myxococcota bacterium]